MYNSNIKHLKEPYASFMKSKLEHILIPYILASAIYIYFAYGGLLDLRTYLSALINFNASSPFYYIVFYIQLVMISRILAEIVEWTGRKAKAVLLYSLELVIILGLAVFAMYHTYILPVHGGGQYLFGGTYLFVFYIGMICGKYCNRIKIDMTKIAAMFLLSVVMLVIWIKYMGANGLILDETVKYFGSFNPPGPTFLIYSFFVICFVWSMCHIIEALDFQLLNSPYKLMAYIGRNTFYIFLLHLYFLSVVRQTVQQMALSNIWLIRFVTFLIALGGSIIIGKLFDYLIYQFPVKLRKSITDD